MSISGNSHGNSSSNMGSTPFFHEFKKQASFFFKEKIKTARLALTDVTPAQLLTEEATNGNPWTPDTRTLGVISRAAFEVDDYWRIVDILHQKLSRFDRKNWKPSYNALVVLERLLTHGPESVAKEFECEEQVIKSMQSFQYVDEKGFNWGLAVRKKSERVLRLLQKGPLLKEERQRARSLSREIQGFGSFTQRTSTSSDEDVLKDLERSHTQFNEHGNQDYNSFPEEDVVAPSTATTTQGGLHRWSGIEDGESLLGGRQDGSKKGLMEEDHPFYNSEKQGAVSLLGLVQQEG